MKIAEINPSLQQTLTNKDAAGQRTRGATTVTKLQNQPQQRPGQDDSVDLRTETAGYALRKFEAMHSVMNEAAGSIRTADEAIQSIGTQIDDMKTTLTAILKQYPPFPPGSEERVAILKSFSALRRQIDALAYPPEDAGAQRILSLGEKDANMQSTVDLGNGHVAINVHRVPVTTGPEGLDIPDLPTRADDDQIRQTLFHLDQARKTLDNKRDLLAEDARHITQLQ